MNEEPTRRGAKVSAQMIKAREMLQAAGGKASPNTVAAAVGLTPSAITRSPWYKAFKSALPPAESPMSKARRLVVDEGNSAYAAAKLAGVAQSSISRAGWYRDHIKENKNV